MGPPSGFRRDAGQTDEMKRVADLLKEDCCIFIGAGIPAALGFPLWPNIAADLIEFVWKTKDAFAADKLTFSIKQELHEYAGKGKPITAITYCRDLLRDVGRERDYQDRIIESLHDIGKYSNARTNAVYIQVGKLIKEALVLQTNLDKSIEEYCKMPSHINTCLPSTISIPCLVYLHGVITDPSSWIMATDEYIEFYQQNDNFVNFIQQTFRERNVLFLGYSLSDKEILEQIAKVSEASKKYILILAESDREKHANAIWESDLKHYKIDVVRYSIEIDGYQALAKFLEGIVSLLMPPVQFAERGQDGSTSDD